MSEPDKNPAVESARSVAAEASDPVEAAVDADPVVAADDPALDLEVIGKKLALLKDTDAGRYAAFLQTLPTANPDALQQLMLHLREGDVKAIRSHVADMRDQSQEVFRGVMGRLRDKDHAAFQKLVGQLQLMAQEALVELFAGLGVTRVVCVDNEYGRLGLDYVIGLVEAAGADGAKGIAFFGDLPLEAGSEVYVGVLTEKWMNATSNEKVAVGHKLRALVGPDAERGASPEDGRDAKDAGFLSLLLKNIEFLPLSLTQWGERRAELLADTAAKKTLFLFDQDMRYDGGGPRDGIRLIRSVLDVTNNHVLCGLLSHTINLDDEYGEWKKYCAGQDGEAPMEPHRFILISKRHLYPDPMSFVRMVRLTGLNARCKELVEKAADVFRRAQESAIAEVKSIDIYDFDHLVFASSQREGVWEPDTIFRLFGIYHRVKAREEARGASNGLEELAEDMRKVSGIATGPRYSRSDRTRQIRHYELYEDAELINHYHMPLELGDVFRTAAGRLFILLRQPCDLMLRKGMGKGRHPDVFDAEVAEIIRPFDDGGKLRPAFDEHQRPKQPDDYFELPCFDATSNVSHYVRFRGRHTVALFVLDLCVFNQDGRAIITVGVTKSEGLTDLWRKHFKLHQKAAKKAFDTYDKINKQEKSEISPLSAFIRSSNIEDIFELTTDVPTKTINYNCQRFLRLCQPRAGTMLTRYASYLSRDAFEHDFTEE